MLLQILYKTLKKLGKTNSTIKNYLSDLRIVYETICNQNGIESLDPFHRTRFRLKHEKKDDMHYGLKK